MNLLGKKVRLEDYLRLKKLFVDHIVIRSIPIVKGRYIYVGEEEFNLERFGESIWVSKRAAIDLDNIEVLIGILKYRIKVSSKIEREIRYLQTTEEIWKVVESLYHFKISSTIEDQEGVFLLFKSLSGSKKGICKELDKLNLCREVILSSLLTMIIKAQNYTEYQGLVSKQYCKQLVIAGKSLKDVKRKFIKYWMSSRNEIEFLNLLFNLKA